MDLNFPDLTKDIKTHTIHSSIVVRYKMYVHTFRETRVANCLNEQVYTVKRIVSLWH